MSADGFDVGHDAQKTDALFVYNAENSKMT